MFNLFLSFTLNKSQGLFSIKFDKSNNWKTSTFHGVWTSFEVEVE